MQRGGFFVAQIPQISRIFALLFWRFVENVVILWPQNKLQTINTIQNNEKKTL
jgi:hypothetical protein